MIDLFRSHVEAGLWNLLPVTDALLRRTPTQIRSLPRNVALRAGDAIHPTTALDAGETEIWTSDRRLLACASHFGLAGRTCVSTPRL